MNQRARPAAQEYADPADLQDEHYYGTATDEIRSGLDTVKRYPFRTSAEKAGDIAMVIAPGRGIRSALKRAALKLALQASGTTRNA